VNIRLKASAPTAALRVIIPYANLDSSHEFENANDQGGCCRRLSDNAEF
jgi:hypothetical protein